MPRLTLYTVCPRTAAGHAEPSLKHSELQRSQPQPGASNNPSNQDATPLEPAGESPDEHIEDFDILGIEFTDYSQFEIRFQSQADQPADLASYVVQFDLFGSRQQYTGTVTGTATSSDKALSAGEYGKITFNAPISMATISKFDTCVVCNGTPEAVYCNSS